jgi:hypothetical protein
MLKSKKAVILRRQNPGTLKGKMTFAPFVMQRYEASSSLCIAAMLVEEDPSYLRMTVFINYVMLNLFQQLTC